MLGLDYRPERIDGPVSRLACTLQVRAADRSALFSLVSRTIARAPGIVSFLKNLTYPESQREGAHSAHPRLRAAGFGFMPAPDFARAENARALRFDLTTALIRHLAEAVRAGGAAFLVLQPNPRQMDVEALKREGVTFRTLSTPDPRPLMWEHDPHLNERGHVWMGGKLVAVVAPYVRDWLDRHPHERSASGPAP